MITQWIVKNLAPISFFTLVILAIVGINISSRSTQNKADLLISQAEQSLVDVDKYDSYLIYKYSTKTEDYKSFAQDIDSITKKLQKNKVDLSPVPTDEEGTQLRDDLSQLLNFKIEIYQKISFDLEPYTSVLEETKTIGRFKKYILNTEKIDHDKRVEELLKISEAGKKILDFNNQKRQGEPKILEKVSYDTELFTKAYDSLKNNPEIDTKLLEDIKSNFSTDADGKEQWPSENVPDYTLDQQVLGSNEMQPLLGDLKESLKAFEGKYRPEKLNKPKS
jgi:hypothetical protein